MPDNESVWKTVITLSVYTDYDPNGVVSLKDLISGSLPTLDNTQICTTAKKVDFNIPSSQ